MPAPFIVGMNGNGAEAFNAGFIHRDLSRHGEWLVSGGALNNQKLPTTMLDRAAHFPKALPTDATGAILKIIDGAFIDAMGQYDLTIDSRFAVQNFTGDANITLANGIVTIGGAPRESGWNLNVNGPFAALTAGERGLRLLPRNDAHPERLYSDGTRAMLETAGVRHYRAMEDVKVNYYDPFTVSMLTDEGDFTGMPGCPVNMLVQLCNDTNSGLTYNFHPAAPQPYIDRVARYAAKNLKKGLRLKVGFGNEVWNEFLSGANACRQGAWRAGLWGTANNGPQPACLGWETGGTTNFLDGYTQPFLPNYNDGGVFKGRTILAIAAGAYMLGNIEGYGVGIWRATNALPQNYIFPRGGDANVQLVLDPSTLNTAKWRYYSQRTQDVLNLTMGYWLTEGHTASNLSCEINVQSGPLVGAEEEILNWPDGNLWLKHAAGNVVIDQAPYWSTYYGDVGNNSVAKTLDLTAFGDRAQIDERKHWVRDRHVALQAKAPAGVTLHPLGRGTYEVNQHNGFSAGTDRQIKFRAYRRDARTGKNLSYAMTLYGLDNPGTNYQVFNLITGENANSAEAWGVFFTQNEALNGPLVNPEAIALKEWNAAAISGVPVADTFYLTEPPAGTATVTAQFAPQVGNAISGVMRASGSRTFDLPFTKAAGAITADVTYTAISGDALTFTIVPQPDVFTVGSLSGGSTVIPPVDPGGSSSDGPAISISIGGYQATDLSLLERIFSSCGRRQKRVVS